MKIIKPEVRVSEEELNIAKLANIERYARVCYQSHPNTQNTHEFLSKIIASGHESVVEHEKITVSFIVDRGIAHQIIRHRIASYSHESTRYCNYSSGKFESEIVVIEPLFYEEGQRAYDVWKNTCLQCEKAYLELCKISSAEQARVVLPTSLKAELVTTFNFRQWRHFFRLRCSSHAHPQIRQVSIPLLLRLKSIFSPVFGDIEYDKDFPEKYFSKIVIS